MNTRDLGATVSKLRKEKGMTQKKLAEQLYVSPSTVSKWETKGIVPDVFMLERLANVLGVSLEYLMEVPTKEKNIDEACVTEDSGKEENISEKYDYVATVGQGTPKMLQAAKNILKTKLKLIIVIVVLGIICASIACSHIYKNHFAEPTFEIIDEFYDDTSKHWGYETLYHVVVVYKGEMNSDRMSEYGDIFRNEYEQWFDEVVTIKISYFKEYTERNQVYNTDCHTFLFPRNK